MPEISIKTSAQTLDLEIADLCYHRPKRTVTMSSENDVNNIHEELVFGFALSLAIVGIINFQ